MATPANEGIMALPESDQAGMPALSMDDSYDAIQSALGQVNPQASQEVSATLRSKLGALPDLTPEQIDAALEVLQELYQAEEDGYAAVLQRLVSEGKASAEDFPEQYDPEFLATAMALLMEAKRSAGPEEGMSEMPAPPVGMARGGIAEAARMVASKGRGGDTMLAHITPQEASMLRRHGGAGTVNPATGLREYGFLSKIWKSVKGAVKDVLSSPIGRIAGTIALAFVMGPAALGITGSTLAAMPLASGAATLLAGGSAKDALKSAAISYLAGPTGPLSSAMGSVTSAMGITNPALAQFAGSALTGAGATLLTGGSLKDAVRSGLVQGAISTALGGARQSTEAPVETRTPVPVDQIPQAPELSTLPGSSAAAPTLPGAAAPTPPAVGAPAAPTAPTAPTTGQVAPPFMDSMGRAVSALGQGEFGQAGSALKDAFFPTSLTDAQLMQRSEFQQFRNQGFTADKALAMTRSAVNPGMMRQYAPLVGAGLGVMGATGGFKEPQPTQTPYQKYINEKLAREQDWLKANPGAFYIQKMPGVTYDPQGRPLLGGVPPPGFNNGGNVNVPSAGAAQAGHNAIFNQQQQYNQEIARLLGVTAPPAPQMPSVLNPYGPPPGLVQPPTTPGPFDGVGPPPPPAPGPITTMPVEIPGPGGGGGGPPYDGGAGTGPVAGRPIVSGPIGDNVLTVGGGTPPGGTLAPVEDRFGRTGDFVRDDGTTAGINDVISATTSPLNDYYNPYMNNLVNDDGTTAGINEIIAAQNAAQLRDQQEMQMFADQSQRLLTGNNNFKNPFATSETATFAGGGLADLQYRLGGAYPPPMNQGMATVQPYGSAVPSVAGYSHGGFPPKTGQISGPGTEKSDSIPAMLSDGEFVMTAKAVRGAGGGSRREGAKRMYALMHRLERNASKG